MRSVQNRLVEGEGEERRERRIRREDLIRERWRRRKTTHGDVRLADSKGEVARCMIEVAVSACTREDGVDTEWKLTEE